uniref:Uncharacterized protein n=1 Tax=Oryza meridionalis TaxID=40149 RepID=A0A0E0D2Q2_9ORYZ
MPPLPPFARQHYRSSALRAPPLLHALASHTAASPSVQCNCLAAPTVEINEVLAPSPPRPHAAQIEEVWVSRIEDNEGGINDELGKGPNNACGEQVQGVGCHCGVGAGGVEGIYGGGREEGVVGGDEAGGAIDEHEAAQERGGPVEDKARVRVVGVADLERLEVGDGGRGWGREGEKGGDESPATASLERERMASASLVVPALGAALRRETSAAMEMLSSGRHVLEGRGRHRELHCEERHRPYVRERRRMSTMAMVMATAVATPSCTAAAPCSLLTRGMRTGMETV